MRIRLYLIPILISSARAETPVVQFVNLHCIECHDEETKKGDLDLTGFSFDPADPAPFSVWVKVHDRVSAGEMPPPKKKQPEAQARTDVSRALSDALVTADQARIARDGRATRRRLNRYEYENTLRDLLSLPWLEVKDFLPEDSEAYGFNKIGDALDVSYVQMARYLQAGEYTLREAMAPQVQQPERVQRRFYAWDQGAMAGKIDLGGPKVRRTFPILDWELQQEMVNKGRVIPRSTVDEAERKREAIVALVSSYEPSELRYNNFKAPVAGRYRLTFSGYSVWMSKDYKTVSKAKRYEPITIYSEMKPRKIRRLGGFDFNAAPTVCTLEVDLLAGESIQPDAARLHRSRPPHHKNPDETSEGMPGVAFQWMEVEGPLIDTWPPVGHRLLFGDLPLQDKQGRVVVEGAIDTDAPRLLKEFMTAAYREPVKDAEVERFLKLVRGAGASGHDFTDSMLAGYTAVLSSPDFLYLEEKPGRLTGTALANRLAYFLWNSPPDAKLRALGQAGELTKSAVIIAQAERLLNDPRSERFVQAFLDYWLELRKISGTAPDAELYPDYQLDDWLVESMTEETRLFFAELIKRNLGVRHLVDSDFAMLNERLGWHYAIPGVHGFALKRVALNDQNNRTGRGGLLTQASVLKVTANGTTTSPVLRGTWILNRILGTPPAPPPPSVGAIEPDTRGATTVREQLEKHRSVESCNACHQHIDPPGFALESYDVMGGWRDRYRSLGEGTPVKGIGHNGLYYGFKIAKPVDASGVFADGTAFKDIHELKKHLAANEAQLARNLAQQLIVYATGAPIGFSDRSVVSDIVEKSRNEGYGIRKLIHRVIQSELFLSK
ncbi:MAG: hypothetical protein ACI9TH_001617 [Kiritimatiellia bacterium]